MNYNSKMLFTHECISDVTALCIFTFNTFTESGAFIQSGPPGPHSGLMCPCLEQSGADMDLNVDRYDCTEPLKPAGTVSAD